MTEMSVSHEHSSLVTQCLDFCRHLASQGKDFNISIKLGSFSFSLDTMEKSTMTDVVMKKKPSPSSLRRSARRRQEFLKKKLPTTSVESTPAAKCSKEDTQKKGMEYTAKNPFKCDHCDSQFENEKGLKCHEGKMHKVTLSPIPQVDGHSEYQEVTIPLELTMENCLHLKYDKPPASVIHPEKGRGLYYDTDPRDGQFSYKFSDGAIWDC